MKTPHKHAELIKAWADGADIEFFDHICHAWLLCQNQPKWSLDTSYRIKPEPKSDVRAWFRSGNINKVMADMGATVGVISSNRDYANLLLTYDGETGELKSAEVL